MELTIDEATTLLAEPDGGSLEMVERPELRTEAPPLYEGLRGERGGAIGRFDWRWDLDLGIRAFPGRPEKAPRYFILGRDAQGRPDGYLIYYVEDRWVNERPRGVLHIEELVGRDTGATTRLWRYAVEVDWISTVIAENRPVDDLLPWLVVDARMIEQKSRVDYEWIRILDPAVALSSRTYLAEGKVVLDIHDPLGHATGRFAIEGGPDGAECRPTTATADLSLSVETVGTVYLGGYPLDLLGQAGRVEEHTSGALARAAAMFRSPSRPGASPTSDRQAAVANRRANAIPRRAMRRVPSSASRSASSSSVTHRRASDSWLPRTCAAAGAITR